MTKHLPVLLDELIDLLQPKSGEHILDATLGGGGMARSMLEKVKPDGSVTAIEQDIKAIKEFDHAGGIQVIHGNFSELDTLLTADQTFDGIYFDLGVSTDQLDDKKRGISFQEESAPLDMRMAQDDDHFTAVQLLNSAGKADLVGVFTAYGQEPRSKAFAREIVRARKIKPFETVADLLAVVKKVYPHKYYKKHPGTKIWQALRIVVNDELSAIEKALPKAFSRLTPGGRLAVISFHSLEDRIVKNYFKIQVKLGNATALNKKVIIPTKTEIRENPRCRSAKLRGIQRSKNKNEKS